MNPQTTLPTPPTQALITQFLELAIESREGVRIRTPKCSVFFWDNPGLSWADAMLLAEPGDILRVRDGTDTVLVEIPKLALDITKALVQKHEMLRWTE